ncbi:hypothetical protein DSO57_1034567 [Entomophthora muscae]|uniref:Uncharacterized protein n=1 Tax=Entomophthora muscae TaxID=34485 RepID=A0ACC2S1X7_9FUNG|nr:hypothetical protein DSO57_1034567 [Entomophthora muscae]
MHLTHVFLFIASLAWAVELDKKATLVLQYSPDSTTTFRQGESNCTSSTSRFSCETKEVNFTLNQDTILARFQNSRICGFKFPDGTPFKHGTHTANIEYCYDLQNREPRFF